MRDRRAVFVIDLGQGDRALDLKDRIDQYRTSLGWSRKYAYLMGVAMLISKNEDNPGLVVDIADYLTEGRKKRDAK